MSAKTTAAAAASEKEAAAARKAKEAAAAARQEAKWAATSGAGLSFVQWVARYGGTGETNPKGKR